MDQLGFIKEQLKGNPKKPPLHLWQPELSGDIDIEIKANGDWFHNGGLIKRKPLVKLFASILRKEPDNNYYLVTPVEKWRIQVEDTPLVIISMDVLHSNTSSQKIFFTTNVDEKFLLSKDYPLTVLTDSETGQPHLSVMLDNNLTAKINRNVYYELADKAVLVENVFSVMSDGINFELGENTDT